MDAEIHHTLYQIKLGQRRLTLFVATFSILVILPTCLVLAGTALIPYIMLGKVAEGFNNALEEYQTSPPPKFQNFKK